MKKRTSAKKVIKIVSLLFLGWFVLHCGFTVMDGLVDEAPHGYFYTANCAVVYGNTVNPDGSPSERLKARLDKSIDLVEMNAVEFVIVSGGLGEEGHYEGTKMAEYLVENGIPEANIIVDNEGWDTYSTGRNAAKIMQERGWYRAYVVSHYFHITRCRTSLRKYDHVQDVYGARAKMGFRMRDLWSIPREFVAFYVYQFRDYEL